MNVLLFKVSARILVPLEAIKVIIIAMHRWHHLLLYHPLNHPYHHYHPPTWMYHHPMFGMNSRQLNHFKATYDVKLGLLVDLLIQQAQPLVLHYHTFHHLRLLTLCFLLKRMVLIFIIMIPSSISLIMQMTHPSLNFPKHHKFKPMKKQLKCLTIIVINSRLRPLVVVVIQIILK